MTFEVVSLGTNDKWGYFSLWHVIWKRRVENNYNCCCFEYPIFERFDTLFFPFFGAKVPKEEGHKLSFKLQHFFVFWSMQISTISSMIVLTSAVRWQSERWYCRWLQIPTVHDVAELQWSILKLWKWLCPLLILPTCCREGGRGRERKEREFITYLLTYLL